MSNLRKAYREQQLANLDSHLGSSCRMTLPNHW